MDNRVFLLEKMIDILLFNFYNYLNLTSEIINIIHLDLFNCLYKNYNKSVLINNKFKSCFFKFSYKDKNNFYYFLESLLEQNGLYLQDFLLFSTLKTEYFFSFFCFIDNNKIIYYNLNNFSNLKSKSISS